MTVYLALLRAVNVGGSGKLPMARLLEFRAEAGLAQARTYIASGNVDLAKNLDERDRCLWFNHGQVRKAAEFYTTFAKANWTSETLQIYKNHRT